MHEFEFIDWLRSFLNDPRYRRAIPMGIGDDMAVINFQGGKLLLGSDQTIEHVHFEFSSATPCQVGHKALGRCLSDCAAMGGVPLAAIVSIARPKTLSEKAVKELYRGMSALARRYACPIVGGDTSASPAGLVIDVCLLGKTAGPKAILRAGAKPGDRLYVTGPLGGSILGKHLTFQPRLPQARWMVDHLPLHAMIDISDGLAGDLAHLCEESRCGAELAWTDLEKVVSTAARKLSKTSGRPALDHALNDGEDFELLAAVAPTKLSRLPAYLKLYPIGRLVKGSKIHVLTAAGQKSELVSRAFRHF